LLARFFNSFIQKLEALSGQKRAKLNGSGKEKLIIQQRNKILLTFSLAKIKMGLENVFPAVHSRPFKVPFHYV